MSRVKLVLVSGIAMVLVALSQSPSVESEYPDSPFEPVAADFPRFIPVHDIPPESDKEAWEQFVERQQAVWRYRILDGAITQASSAEQRAVRAAWYGEYVTARTEATDVLHADPDSIPAIYALATVEAFGQSNLPYALYLVREARHRLQEIGEDRPYDTDAREWYISAVVLEHDVVQLMDRREEQLRCIDLLEQLYEPMPWLRIWPLMKLERFDEAQEFIELALADGKCRINALNGRTALEDRMQHRMETYAAGEQLTNARPDEALTWHNWAFGSYNMFRFDEAEEQFLRATEMGDGSDPDGSSFIDLAILYTQQARVPEAFDALKKANRRQARKDVWARDQNAALLDIARAQWMLVTGHTGEAEQFARRAAQTPDRAGTTSMSSLDLDFSNHMMLWTVLTVRLAELREYDAVNTGLAGFVPDVSIRQRQLELWQLNRALARQLTGKRLIDLVRPNVPGGAGFETGTPSWLRHGIAQVVAPGLALEAVQQARQIDDVPETAAYLDAFEAEIRLRLGDDEEAVQLAEKALDGLLRQGEMQLRCRVRAIAGEACRRIDDMPAALAHWDSVLRTCPQVLRLLEIDLPVRIETDGSRPAERLRSSLLKSPRFSAHDAGFRVTLSETGEGLQFKFDRTHGARHLIGTAGPEQGAEDGSVEAVEAIAHWTLHDRLMQPFVDFTQSDLDSLNGSPSAAQYHETVGELLESL